MNATSTDIASRIRARCVPNTTGCLEWQGATAGGGYGHIWWLDRLWYTHRAIWTAEVGPIPAGLTIDHLCKNRLCCNVEHMEVVTRGENSRRGGGIDAARAARLARTTCSHGHNLTPENIEWRRGARACRTCRREQWRQWKARKLGAAR